MTNYFCEKFFPTP